jgi:hypothetical protein
MSNLLSTLWVVAANLVFAWWREQTPVDRRVYSLHMTKASGRSWKGSARWRGGTRMLYSPLSPMEEREVLFPGSGQRLTESARRYHLRHLGQGDAHHSGTEERLTRDRPNIHSSGSTCVGRRFERFRQSRPHADSSRGELGSRASLPLQHDQDAKDRSLRKRRWVAPCLDSFACCRTLQQRLCPFAERVHVGSRRGPPSYPL